MQLILQNKVFDLFLGQFSIVVSLARVAQSAERSAVNRKVGGSNPPVSEFLFLSFSHFFDILSYFLFMLTFILVLFPLFYIFL